MSQSHRTDLAYTGCRRRGKESRRLCQDARSFQTGIDRSCRVCRHPGRGFHRSYSDVCRRLPSIHPLCRGYRHRHRWRYCWCAGIPHQRTRHRYRGSGHCRLPRRSSRCHSIPRYRTGSPGRHSFRGTRRGRTWGGRGRTHRGLPRRRQLARPGAKPDEHSPTEIRVSREVLDTSWRTTGCRACDQRPGGDYTERRPGRTRTPQAIEDPPVAYNMAPRRH